MTHTKTVGEALEMARRVLAPTGDTAGLDAQVILSDLTGRPRTWLLAHPEADLTSDQLKALDARLARLASGFPLPYLLGEWEFYDRKFAVTPDVLIPRPETEMLVELALEWLTANPGRPRVLDVGTGSGCIAVILAQRFPAARIEAVDISPAALAVATENARRHNLPEIRFAQSDLLEIFSPELDRFDLLCANLPYIPTGVLQRLKVGRFEPFTALSGGHDGLALIRRMLFQAPRYMQPAGRILLEIEANQGDEVAGLARMAFPQAGVTLHQDLAGLDRIVQIDLS